MHPAIPPAGRCRPTGPRGAADRVGTSGTIAPASAAITVAVAPAADKVPRKQHHAGGWSHAGSAAHDENWGVDAAAAGCRDPSAPSCSQSTSGEAM